MKLKIKAGTTSKRIKVYVQDSTGAGKTGVLHSDVAVSFVRESATGTGTLTLFNTTTLGNYSTNCWVEVNSSVLPGLYEFHIPNSFIDTAAGASVVIMFRANGSTATGMLPVLVEIELDQIDYQSSSYANLEASAGTIVTGTVSTTSSGTTSLVASALPSSVDDHYNGRVLIFTSGTLSAQATNITDYVGSTKTLTFTALSSAPQSGNTFIIV